MIKMAASRSYYEMIGVKRDASSKKIKKAIDKLAEEHKDKEDYLKDLQKISDILTNDDERKKYDEEIKEIKSNVPEFNIGENDPQKIVEIIKKLYEGKEIKLYQVTNEEKKYINVSEFANTILSNIKNNHNFFTSAFHIYYDEYKKVPKTTFFTQVNELLKQLTIFLVPPNPEKANIDEIFLYIQSNDFKPNILKEWLEIHNKEDIKPLFENYEEIDKINAGAAAIIKEKFNDKRYSKKSNVNSDDFAHNESYDEARDFELSGKHDKGSLLERFKLLTTREKDLEKRLISLLNYIHEIFKNTKQTVDKGVSEAISLKDTIDKATENLRRNEHIKGSERLEKTKNHLLDSVLTTLKEIKETQEKINKLNKDATDSILKAKHSGDFETITNDFEVNVINLENLRKELQDKLDKLKREGISGEEFLKDIEIFKALVPRATAYGLELRHFQGIDPTKFIDSEYNELKNKFDKIHNLLDINNYAPENLEKIDKELKEIHDVLKTRKPITYDEKVVKESEDTVYAVVTELKEVDGKQKQVPISDNNFNLAIHYGSHYESIKLERHESIVSFKVDLEKLKNNVDNYEEENGHKIVPFTIYVGDKIYYARGSYDALLKSTLKIPAPIHTDFKPIGTKDETVKINILDKNNIKIKNNYVDLSLDVNINGSLEKTNSLIKISDNEYVIITSEINTTNDYYITCKLNSHVKGNIDSEIIKIDVEKYLDEDKVNLQLEKIELDNNTDKSQLKDVLNKLIDKKSKFKEAYMMLTDSLNGSNLPVLNKSFEINMYDGFHYNIVEKEDVEPGVSKLKVSPRILERVLKEQDNISDRYIDVAIIYNNNVYRYKLKPKDLFASSKKEPFKININETELIMDEKHFKIIQHLKYNIKNKLTDEIKELERIEKEHRNSLVKNKFTTNIKELYKSSKNALHFIDTIKEKYTQIIEKLNLYTFNIEQLKKANENVAELIEITECVKPIYPKLSIVINNPRFHNMIKYIHTLNEDVLHSLAGELNYKKQFSKEKYKNYFKEQIKKMHSDDGAIVLVDDSNSKITKDKYDIEIEIERSFEKIKKIDTEKKYENFSEFFIEPMRLCANSNNYPQHGSDKLVPIKITRGKDILFERVLLSKLLNCNHLNPVIINIDDIKRIKPIKDSVLDIIKNIELPTKGKQKEIISFINSFKAKIKELESLVDNNNFLLDLKHALSNVTEYKKALDPITILYTHFEDGSIVKVKDFVELKERLMHLAGDFNTHLFIEDFFKSTGYVELHTEEVEKIIEDKNIGNTLQGLKNLKERVNEKQIQDLINKFDIKNAYITGTDKNLYRNKFEDYMVSHLSAILGVKLSEYEKNLKAFNHHINVQSTLHIRKFMSELISTYKDAFNRHLTSKKDRDTTYKIKLLILSNPISVELRSRIDMLIHSVDSNHPVNLMSESEKEDIIFRISNYPESSKKILSDKYLIPAIEQMNMEGSQITKETRLEIKEVIAETSEENLPKTEAEIIPFLKEALSKRKVKLKINRFFNENKLSKSQIRRDRRWWTDQIKEAISSNTFDKANLYLKQDQILMNRNDYKNMWEKLLDERDIQEQIEKDIIKGHEPQTKEEEVQNKEWLDTELRKPGAGSKLGDLVDDKTLQKMRDIANKGKKSTAKKKPETKKETQKTFDSPNSNTYQENKKKSKLAKNQQDTIAWYEAKHVLDNLDNLLHIEDEVHHAYGNFINDIENIHYDIVNLSRSKFSGNEEDYYKKIEYSKVVDISDNLHKVLVNLQEKIHKRAKQIVKDLHDKNDKKKLLVIDKNHKKYIKKVESVVNILRNEMHKWLSHHNDNTILRVIDKDSKFFKNEITNNLLKDIVIVKEHTKNT